MNTCPPRTFCIDTPEQTAVREPREHFNRLLRQYQSLAHSFDAVDQREHDRLNGTLMRLYLELNPRSAYRHYDDIETVLRRATNSPV